MGIRRASCDSAYRPGSACRDLPDDVGFCVNDHGQRHDLVDDPVHGDEVSTLDDHHHGGPPEEGIGTDDAIQLPDGPTYLTWAGVGGGDKHEGLHFPEMIHAVRSASFFMSRMRFRLLGPLTSAGRAAGIQERRQPGVGVEPRVLPRPVRDLPGGELCRGTVRHPRRAAGP